MRTVDNEGKSIKTSCLSTLISAEDRKEVDEKISLITAFGFVNNKLYRTSIVKEKDIKFITTSNLNEDRVFNFNYLQFARSMRVVPAIGYNYFLNMSSITHEKRISPYKFVNTAKATDIIIGNGLLGKNIGEEAANFYFKFYTRAFGICLTYPLKVLPAGERLRLIGDMIGSFCRSNVLKKYKIKIFKWMFANVAYYAKKAIRR